MKTAFETAKAVSAGELTARQSVSAALAEIAKRDGQIDAFLEVFEKAALAQADAIDARKKEGKKLGRLAGVCVAIKDNMEMTAFYKGDSSLEVIERDDGYIDVADGKKWYLSDYKNWSGREKRALKLARGRVLDIGCGAGRHSLYLQQKGFDVTGMFLTTKLSSKVTLAKALSLSSFIR